MVTLGVDAHKRTHTVVAVDEHGLKLGERTIGTTTKDHLGLLRWATQFGDVQAVGARPGIARARRIRHAIAQVRQSHRQD
jgi:hypothetical protein